MGWGEKKYDDHQRAAVIFHKNVRKYSGKVISNLAAKGELETATGLELDPFEIPPNTVYSLARNALTKERGREASELTHALPADANEEIRRRIIEIVDRETRKLRDQARRGGKADPELIKRWARAAREAAALPGYGLKAPPPGRQAEGAPEGEAVTKARTAAGQILAAARGSSVPAQSEPNPQSSPMVELAKETAQREIQPKQWDDELARTMVTEAQQEALNGGDGDAQDGADEPFEVGGGPGSRARTAVAAALPSA